ncbi:MAG: M42 family peptidase [Desulfitobacteriia bacterium]|jgi:putative aminopeptidase FrvX
MAENFLTDYGLLMDLSQKFGPSGNEKEVRDFIKDQISSVVDAIDTDTLGNLIAHKKGKGLKIMIACHMDEVGVIITHIDEQGYLYFAPVGGLKNTDLLGKRVAFRNNRIGIVCKEPVRVGKNTTDKIYIDIGVTGESEARKEVGEGDMAVLVGSFVETDSCLISKALDNRLGCFLAIELLKKVRCEHELFFAFTCQEEVGARGAKTAAYSIRPDLALIIDTTRSYDSPPERKQPSLGQGVAIKAMDRSIIVSPKIKNWMANIAYQKKIAYQWEVITTGSTDAGPIHLTGGGIPTGGIALPLKNLHTGNEIAAKTDITAAFKLLRELILNPLA